MSYDLILRAQTDLAAESISNILPRLEAIAAQYGWEVFLYQGAPLTAGDMLGWIRLAGDLADARSSRQRAGIEQLIELGDTYGFSLYDPQRGQALSGQALQDLPGAGLIESATRLVDAWLEATVSPHGFRKVVPLRFSRTQPELFQHVIAALTSPSDGAPGRLDLKAGWTLRVDEPQAETAEDVSVFTYLQAIQSIGGLRNIFHWPDLNELEDILDRLAPVMVQAVLPWLEARRTVQDLLRLYHENPAPEAFGLYFGHPPRNYWLLAQVYRERGEWEAEASTLQRFVHEATADAPPPWLAGLVEQAGKRLAELAETRS